MAHAGAIPSSRPSLLRTPDMQYAAGWPRASWGAVMMGVLTAVAAQFVFTVLALAIGVTAADSDAQANRTEGIGVAAGAWWLITGTIALVIGGMVYGRASGLVRSTQLHLGALAMWAAVAVFGFAVVWSGAGVAASAASPIAAVSMSRLEADASFAAPGNAAGAWRADAERAPDGTSAVAGSGVRAARAASWWAVIGLLAGAAASVWGACLGCRREGAPEPLA